MERPTCETCPYWRDLRNPKNELDESGECRRYPPTPNKQVSLWPLTYDLHWCGEHPDFPAYIASLKSKID